MTYTLYNRPGSGGFVVEAALTLAGAPFELIELGSKAGTPLPESFRETNPWGQLPTLILPNGTTMTETSAILVHLALCFPDKHLAPPPGTSAHGAFLRWTTFANVNLYEAVVRRGKSMLIKNLLHHAVLNGFTARFTTASDMLHELAAQDSDASLARRLRRFTGPQLLAIDEVGYLNYDNRYADLLFEVVTRRYLTVPVLITTNKPFSEWAEVFSSAACVVTLVDRLIHRSEIVHLDGESYRLREAKEQAAKRSKARSRRTAKPRASREPRS